MVENQTDEEMSLIHVKFRQKFDMDFKEKERRKERRENREESNKNFLFATGIYGKPEDMSI